MRQTLANVRDMINADGIHSCPPSASSECTPTKKCDSAPLQLHKVPVVIGGAVSQKPQAIPQLHLCSIRLVTACYPPHLAQQDTHHLHKFRRMNNRPALGDYAPAVYRPRPFDGMVQTGPPGVRRFDRPSGLCQKANRKSRLLQA
jgi:hypothetical protein